MYSECVRVRAKVKKKDLCRVICFWVVWSVFLVGCGLNKGEKELGKVEYTVLKYSEIPKTLATQIEQRKEGRFELVYSDNEFMYLARGYGEQETGGYCIQVEDCYHTEHMICVKTRLVRPQAGEAVNKEPSYPYLVLKMELREKKVKFL